MNKIEDFGVHANQYYSLDISYFKSSLDGHMLDQLWNKYWVNTLASSPLIATRQLATGQANDIAAKLEAANGELLHSGRLGRLLGAGKPKEEAKLAKITRDTSKLAAEQIKGLSCQVIKDALFNVRPVGTGTAPTPSPQLLSAAVSVAATSEATPMES